MQLNAVHAEIVVSKTIGEQRQSRTSWVLKMGRKCGKAIGTDD
jgi:hypothetical protein